MSSDKNRLLIGETCRAKSDRLERAKENGGVRKRGGRDFGEKRLLGGWG